MGKAKYNLNQNGSNKVKSDKDADSEKPEAGTFRTILPQILASTAKNFLLLDLGMAVAFPTIVIPALRGLKNYDNNETLSFTNAQASWFASVAFIFQPIGSILSGIVLEPLGRKRSMILVNAPHIVGWLMLYYAKSLEAMYGAAILLGLGVGLMEAPIVTYVGEICQPSIRGILISCSGIAATLGFVTVYVLGTIGTWRVAALCCLCVPLATVVAICFVPETPLWLLSKGRNEEALESLQWLRGWVSPKAVEKEFQEIQRYSEDSNRCIKCQKAQISCTHSKASAKDKVKELLRKRTMKPFILVIAMFAFIQFSGLSGMRPYLVQIFQAFGVPMDANYATVVIGMLGFTANVLCTMIIKFVGKRKIALYSMAGTCVSVLALAIYAYLILPSGWNSFDKHTGADQILNDHGLGYIPLILIFLLAFSVSFCHSVPWMLLSEVFPFKSRGIASGITAALNYIMAFVTTKTYYNLETSLSLFGIICVYGIFDLFAFIFIYMFIPETERRSLEDIEIHFSDNSKKFTDIKIMKNAKQQISLSTPNKNGCDNRAFSEDDKKY